MEEWYYSDGGRQVGPMGEGDIERLAKAGKITSKTLVWHSGMTDWQEYGKVKAPSVATPAVSPRMAGVTPTVGQSVCSECGKAFPREDMIPYGDAWVCALCKPIFVQKLKEGVSLSGAMEYGGFWIRLGAKFIDWIIITVAMVALYAVVVPMMGSARNPSSFLAIQGLLMLLQFAIPVAYGTWFLGRFAATIGKMACGLKVVTAEGGRVTYARALGRCLAEIISQIILYIGYIIAASDDEKRTLHDRICNTRVVKK
jgi:uncharacterized RDD family membrane protein YckC